MPRTRVPALPNSPSFQQLWEVLGSKLMDAAQGKLPSKQAVAGSSPVSRSTDSNQGTRRGILFDFPQIVQPGCRRPLAI